MILLPLFGGIFGFFTWICLPFMRLVFAVICIYWKPNFIIKRRKCSNLSYGWKYTDMCFINMLFGGYVSYKVNIFFAPPPKYTFLYGSGGELSKLSNERIKFRVAEHKKVARTKICGKNQNLTQILYLGGLPGHFNEIWGGGWVVKYFFLGPP